jgi:GNAT superfamily N-acetyltransferase
MAGAFQVRPAVPEDFGQWLPLWGSYNDFYGRSGATALPATVTDTTWRRFFEEHEPIYALVAEADGELIGLAHYLFHRSTTAAAHSCYLQDLFTSKAARGSGVATALIHRVRDEAKAAGSPSVYWQTQETNDVARRLYDKIAQRSGFIVYRAMV